MMRVFDEFSRTREDYPGCNEGHFNYLNESARPEAARIRTMLDGWFARFPETAKSDVVARLRSRDNRQHQSAFFELYLHELFVRLGYALQVHPDIDGATTHPDFLVTRSGEPAFYLEATVPFPPEAEVGEQARVDRLYETLERMESPNLFVAVHDVRGGPASAAPGARLRRGLERWLAGLDPDEVFAQVEAGAPYPSYGWEQPGWELAFEALPKSAALRGRPGVRPIGASMSQVQCVTVHERVGRAVNEKGGKYGSLGLPYLLAINLVDELVEFREDDPSDVFDGLLGQEIRVVTRRPGGGTTGEMTRGDDGAWFGPAGPRNTVVSALLIGVRVGPWAVAHKAPHLVHHLQPSRPLTLESWPFPEWIWEPEPGGCQALYRPGAPSHVLFGLGPGWPRED